MALMYEVSTDKLAIPFLKRRIRALLIFFMIGLVLSGVTAFPLVWELGLLHQYLGPGTIVENWFPSLSNWIAKVYQGLVETDAKYPFILYGTDWLAFAHLMIAVAFYGPLKDPVKNVWIIEFGMISCLLIIPLAFICGPIRGIPFYWQLIDCSFGVFGILPLWLAYKDVKQINKIQSA